MANNLIKKISMPLALSSAFLFSSFDSKSQDFLPGKFNNYSNKKELIDYWAVFLDDTSLFELSYYDVDSNKTIDVIELSPVKIEEGKPKVSDYPIGYGLFYEDGRKKFFYDSKMDGWNQNEEITDGETYDFSNYNL